MEAIADVELWTWALNFGNPGSLNFIHMLDSSKIVEGIQCRKYGLKCKIIQIFLYFGALLPKWSRNILCGRLMLKSCTFSTFTCVTR